MEQCHSNNTASLASVANPINGITTNTVQNVLYRVPYLGYQAVGVRGTAFDAYANYNSLQATVRKAILSQPPSGSLYLEQRHDGRVQRRRQ